MSLSPDTLTSFCKQHHRYEGQLHRIIACSVEIRRAKPSTICIQCGALLDQPRKKCDFAGVCLCSKCEEKYHLSKGLMY